MAHTQLELMKRELAKVEDQLAEACLAKRAKRREIDEVIERIDAESGAARAGDQSLLIRLEEEYDVIETQELELADRMRELRERISEALAADSDAWNTGNWYGLQ